MKESYILIALAIIAGASCSNHKIAKVIHYRLSKGLIKELDAYLNVDGIPFYVLVEKDGTFTGRPDLRVHNKYVQELLKRVK